MNVKDHLLLAAQDLRKSPELQQLLRDAVEEIERLEVFERRWKVILKHKALQGSSNGYATFTQAVDVVLAQQDKKED